ncbi:hypothetical protein AB1Y20_022109 [Prymnesium parvum]|uniref:O-fucosyltransferase family protein n=1 Tax=Prymnesium parvum TaxID=97485 RepID=A0AB34JG96_PRYPA
MGAGSSHPTPPAELSRNCTAQPWTPGCRPTAERLGLAALSAAYRAQFDRAVATPSRARYLVISTGGGFGNQMAEVVTLTLAALLTDRLLVNLPNLSRWATLTGEPERHSFDMRRYFLSSAFPYHGSPSILRAIADAERGIGTMSHGVLPCPACPRIAPDEAALLAALSSRNGAQVLRLVDFDLGKGARYTVEAPSRVRALLKAARSRALPRVRALPRHADEGMHDMLWQLLLEPTPRVLRQLSAYSMPLSGEALSVHVRSGDAAMLAGQMTTPKLASSWSQGNKCGLEVRDAGQVEALLQCIERLADGAKIFLATDYAPLVPQAASRFGTQMLPPTPGEPRHTFRPMDKVGSGNASASQDAVDDPHMKQMLDFVLLASSPKLMLTCGSYGEGARAFSHVVKTVVHYSSSHGCPTSATAQRNASTK